MGFRWLVFSLFLSLVANSQADQKSFDCPMRSLAMEYARKIQPNLSTQKLQEIADALNGAKEAQNCNVSVKYLPSNNNGRATRVYAVPSRASTFYVDASSGSDSNSGAMSSPFKTVDKAIMAARAAGQGSTIVLRKGTYYLTDTITLNTQDKGLTIQNYNDEEVWISGGKVITPTWEKFDVDASKKTNIYKADLSSQGIDTVPGLRINTKRAIRARYPNADPELGFGSGLKAEKWVPPTLPTAPDTEINPDTPVRNSSSSFQKYQLGIGGPCKNFDPPAGYWCGSHTGGGGAATYKVPSGMVATKKTLPNSPYKNAK